MSKHALTLFVAVAAAAPVRAGIEDLTYPSQLLNQDVPIKVYTPPGYDGGADRYPVVYNLHGAGGGSPERQCDRCKKTLSDAMDNKKIKPMIYVFVDGIGDTFFIDYATGAPKVETMIVTELIPWVDANYRTVAGRHGRGVDGFSMGGFGCLMLAFRHPELFSTVVSYGAALIDPVADKPGDRKTDKPKADAANPDAPVQKDALVTTYPRAGRWGDKAYSDKYNPRALAKTNADVIRTGVKVRVVCGDADGLYQRNVTFKDLLAELKIPCDWVSVPGVAHDTKGLFDRVGLESMKFMQAAFDAAAKATP